MNGHIEVMGFERIKGNPYKIIKCGNSPFTTDPASDLREIAIPKKMWEGKRDIVCVHCGKSVK